MKRSARSRKAPAGAGSLLREGVAMTASAAMRNPAAVGGATAFAVTLAYVSANALWYQPHAHPSAYFTTRVVIGDAPSAERFADPAPTPPAPSFAPQRLRDPAPMQPRASRETDDIPALIANETTAAVPRGDDRVRLVQEVLKTLDLYAGDVDGLAGPQTGKAVERYQRIVGLEPTGQIDDRLLAQLGAGSRPASSQPGELAELPASAPVPYQKTVVSRDQQQAAAPQPAVARTGDPMVVRIQAGLRAFGHDGIELDGVVGARTRAAIREFQSLFGLPETGEPDAALFAKMREVGLTE